MNGDDFQEFLENAVEEEAEGLFGPSIDPAYSSAYDDARSEIEDELKSHVEQCGFSEITETEARECIRTALLHYQQGIEDGAEAGCVDA